MNKKSFLLALTIVFSVQLLAMETEPGKKEIKEEKKTTKKNNQISNNLKKVAPVPEGGVIVSQGEIFEGYIYLNLNEKESLTQSTFEELIEEQKEKNLPFILAMVTTICGKNNTKTIRFYEAAMLNSYLKQTNQQNRHIEGFQSTYKDVTNKQPILGLEYFTISSVNDDFKYLASDYDLFKGDEKSNFMKTYFAANLRNDQAMVELGMKYEDGSGVEKDLKEAFNWYKKAADLGAHKAMFQLGIMYKKGLGVEKDLKKAFYWYKKAANLGNKEATLNLGLMYKDGLGVEKDLKEAFYWFKKASDLGYEEATLNLGLMYKDGLGVEKDLDQAKNLFKKAAKKGSKQAKENLKKLMQQEKE